MIFLLNGHTPASLGLTVVGGEFRSGSASSIRVEAAEDFDAVSLTEWGHGTDVACTVDSAPFFSGKVKLIPTAASAEREGRSYLIEDAWAELETCTYQETWPLQTGTILMPYVILGLDQATGARIDLGAQIEAVITFAASAGISIQMGTTPTGLDLWPTEANGISCAEAIRTCLRFHPDWIPWIDHSSSPPTFNVTPRASATAVSLAVTDCSHFQIVERPDRVPDCVRLLFSTATTYTEAGDDGETFTYRDGTIQKYPTDGPDSGPGVLTSLIELSGGQASIAKQQIETRPIPHKPADGATAPQILAAEELAKEWIKQHHQWLVNEAGTPMDNDKFLIHKWQIALARDLNPANPLEANPKPDPINMHVTPMLATTLAHVPRELVSGTLHEWMHKRQGEVAVRIVISATQKATDKDRELIAQLPPVTYCMGTNATTKIYRGRPQWQEYAELIEPGIAQAYYNTIAGGCMYEGSATLVDEGNTLGAMTWHGCKLNLTGGIAGWATMAAPIHAIQWDLQSEEVTITFGPNPDYALPDFLEYLSLLRKRPPCWMSADERTSPEMGDKVVSSGRTDHVNPPVKAPLAPQPPPATPLPPFWVSLIPEGTHDAPTYKLTVNPGYVFERNWKITPTTDVAPSHRHFNYHAPDNLTETVAGLVVPKRFSFAEDDWVYCNVTETIATGLISAVTLEVSADDKDNATVDDDTIVHHYCLAQIVADGAAFKVRPFLAGSHIEHWIEGKGLDLKVVTYYHSASGWISKGSEYDVTHYFRRGHYIGTTDPGTDPDYTQEVTKMEGWG